MSLAFLQMSGQPALEQISRMGGLDVLKLMQQVQDSPTDDAVAHHLSELAANLAVPGRINPWFAVLSPEAAHLLTDIKTSLERVFHQQPMMETFFPSTPSPPVPGSLEGSFSVSVTNSDVGATESPSGDEPNPAPNGRSSFGSEPHGASGKNSRRKRRKH